MENTTKKGKYRWIVFKKGTEWYGAALEFNIVQVGDDPRLVYVELQEAVQGYLEAAQKMKGFREKTLRPMLNQKSDDLYEDLWDKVHSSTKQSASALPSNVFSFGTSNLAVA